MKVLYAIQGTGNGHLSRAREIVPVLKEYADVDLLVSGTQSQVSLPWEPDYYYKGFSFCYNRRGGVSKMKSVRENLSPRLIREIKSLPVEQYDLVINDFEPVSAWAARKQGVPCIAMSHQAAYLSDKSPRPFLKDRFGEMVLRRYAPADRAIGFHFMEYDDYIQTPVIRRGIRELSPSNKGYFMVYLPAYKDHYLGNILAQLPKADWVVFSKYTFDPYRLAPNVQILPIKNDEFVRAFQDCEGILTGGGFETPAEAKFLGKKVFSIPIKGQYEQQCNAAALARLHCPVASHLSVSLLPELQMWIEEDQPPPVLYPDHTRLVIEEALEMSETIRQTQSVG